MHGTLKKKVQVSGTWNVNSKFPALQKIKEESTWYVTSKCHTGTLEIKVASAKHLKCKL